MSSPFEKRPLSRILERPAAHHTPGVDGRAVEDRFRLCADFWRTLAHPKRLQILAILKDREANVTTIANDLELHAVNVSQELAPLRAVGLVKTRREGKHVFYRLSSPKVQAVCDLLADVMREVTAARVSNVIHEPDRTAPASSKVPRTQTFTPWKP